MKHNAARGRDGRRGRLDAARILDALTRAGEPLDGDELAQVLRVGPHGRAALEQELAALVHSGQLLRDRRGRYGTRDALHLLRGTVSAHPDGYGFLIPDTAHPDLYLSAREMRRVLHGDQVLAGVTGMDARGRAQGTIVEVLERKHQRIVGRYCREDGAAYLLAHDRRITHEIVLAEATLPGLVDGVMVVAELTRQPDGERPPLGRVVEVLGSLVQPGMEVELALRKHDIPWEWPAPVLREGQALPAEVTARDRRGRDDDTVLKFVTIDGEDARDYDDAVYAERLYDGWRLCVAIADVAHYLRPGSALDQEARARGTSVYFPDRVVPMLPEALSNGLCSLRPEVERLVLICDMQLRPDGSVRRYVLRRSRIVSRARLTYGVVSAALEGDRAAKAQCRGVLRELLRLKAVYELLAAAREARGVVDFETPETRIVFGPQREVLGVEEVHRGVAHRLIEECMILANRCTAEFVEASGVPALYRVHAGPEPERVQNLRSFVAELGLKLPGGDKPQPADYAALIAQTLGRPDQDLIQTVVLRSLKQARYEPDNSGHFGLALEAYTHFTSPIRRYPDLLVHRAIVHALAGRASADYALDHAAMTELGVHCSSTERRADDATREVQTYLKCLYLRDHVGTVMDGVIGGVAPFGLFVTLAGVHADGLVHVTALPRDYYNHDPVHHRLTGERTGQVHRLGDTVRVRVLRVDLEDRKVDLELVRGSRGSA